MNPDTTLLFVNLLLKLSLYSINKLHIRDPCGGVITIVLEKEQIIQNRTLSVYPGCLIVVKTKGKLKLNLHRL